jgi:8-oxo-dGTP pyrophosphatase MutT (NUDIX family)
MLHAGELDALRSALEADPRPAPGPHDRLAGVLVPIVARPTPSLVLTVRAATLSRHAGEVSFPGGLQDPGETLERTALREAHEELGLDPSMPRLLGALPAVHTFVSGILVVPFVGVVDELPALTVNDAEIDEVVVLEVAGLASVERSVAYDRPGGGVWRGFVYELGGHTVWGATGTMLHALLEAIRKETTWANP